MRTPTTSLLAVALFAAACGSSAAPPAVPPALTVTSPVRSTVQDGAGALTVTGTVAPSSYGSPVTAVNVNGVPATIGADGSFAATVQVQPGAQLIHTEALAADGGKATDTRSVHAGEQRAVGSSIDNGITAAISAHAFTQISGVASGLIGTTDWNALLAPMQPMQHAGDGNGPDCLYDQLFVDDLTFQGATVSLVPVDGGIAFTLTIDHLDVPAHASYAVACLDGHETLEVTADKVVVSGTLLVSPDGKGAFDTVLDSPDVQLTNFHLDAGGVPGEILDMIDMDHAIGSIIATAAEKYMGPMMNQTLAGLGGTKQLAMLGHTIDVAVTPSDLTFDPTGAQVALSTTFMIEGAEHAPGFTFTPNGTPTMTPGDGMAIGLADDLANEALAETTALDMLKLSQSIPGGTFDTVALDMTTPPMISADPSDGQMRLFLGDVKMTFQNAGTPVATAYLNAKVDLAVVPSNGGGAVGLQLGTPDIAVDVDHSQPNATELEPEDLATAVELTLGQQIKTMSVLLSDIPLPMVEGLYLEDVSVGADHGYLMIDASLQ